MVHAGGAHEPGARSAQDAGVQQRSAAASEDLRGGSLNASRLGFRVGSGLSFRLLRSVTVHLASCACRARPLGGASLTDSSVGCLVRCRTAWCWTGTRRWARATCARRRRCSAAPPPASKLCTASWIASWRCVDRSRIIILVLPHPDADVPIPTAHTPLAAAVYCTRRVSRRVASFDSFVLCHLVSGVRCVRVVC